MYLIFLPMLGSLALGIAIGLFMASRKATAPKQEQVDPLIDVTLHKDVLDILTAAVKSPAMSYLRRDIEKVLLESGYTLVGGNCKTGKCGPRIWKPRPYPQFVKHPIG